MYTINNGDKKGLLITSDFHTHTIFSHGKGTIEENVRRAERLGIKEIAITDHGLRHIIFGLRPRKVKKMRAIIDELQKTTDVKILLGVEANLSSRDGEIDIRPDQREWFDIVVCGFHKAVFSRNIIEWFAFVVKNLILQFFHLKQSERTKAINTRALCLAVEKNNIDILSHVNHDMHVDAVEVAKTCAKYGTYFEINAKKEHVDTETLKKVEKTGVGLIIDSDAHTPERVGEFALSLEMCKKADIPLERIANYNKTPIFNSQTRNK